MRFGAAIDLHVPASAAGEVSWLGVLTELGVDEVRCYALSEETHTARLEAVDALGEFVAEI